MAKRTNRYLLAVMGFLAASASALPASRSAGAHESEIAISADGEIRIIRSNGIPDHNVGAFPNRANPNSISPQRNNFRIPMNPVRANRTIPLRRDMMFGVAVNGVPFDPGTAEFWQNDPQSGWRYEALSGKIDLGLDENNAHVQPNGAYHYHGLPKGLATEMAPDKHSPLIGYAADGFPVYGYYGYGDPKDPSKGIKKLRSGWRLKPGMRKSGPGGEHDGRFVEDWLYQDGAGDLDESNARFTITPEFPNGTYAYFITEGFPHIPRSFIGTPDGSFMKGPPGGRHPGRFHIRDHGPSHSGLAPPRRPR